MTSSLKTIDSARWLTSYEPSDVDKPVSPNKAAKPGTSFPLYHSQHTSERSHSRTALFGGGGTQGNDVLGSWGITFGCDEYMEAR